jgi:SAM-dependent methyltransferase
MSATSTAGSTPGVASGAHERPGAAAHSYAGAVNEEHRVLCASDMWATVVKEQMLPWVFRGIDDDALGDHVVEIGPGPGKTTDLVRTKATRLTAVELDVDLARALAARFEGTNVEVVQHDATSLPFPDGTFSAGVCFTMLHHVPTVELQDRLLAELVRVVRPGGLVIGSDSVASTELAALHTDDTYNPIDPAELPERLRRAGLGEVEVRANEFAFRFRGTA